MAYLDYDPSDDISEEDPHCDICGRRMNDSPNVMDYGLATEVDWNGETGNHKYCEERETDNDCVE